MKKTALCPGTYDPLTEGHCDVIIRCSKVFSKVVVAISKNPRKKPLYSLEKRIEFARKVLGNIENIEIVPFEGLLVFTLHYDPNDENKNNTVNQILSTFQFTE